MKINLTTARIKRLRTEAEDQIIWDGKTPHFGIRIRSNGSMRYIHMIAVDGKMTKATIGDVQAMPLGEARKAAIKLNMGEASAPTPPCPLFADYVWDIWWPQHTAPLKPATKRWYLSSLRVQLLPAFGGLAMDAITKKSILNWFDRYSRTSPGGANRVLVGLKTILNHAVRGGVITKNRAKGIVLNPRKKMTRFLSDDERARLLTALDKVPNCHQMHADIIRLLLFTGCRRGEVLNLRWNEVAENTLTLRDSKTGPRIVWISEEAAEIIEKQRQRRMASPYVFPRPKDARKSIVDIYTFWFPLRRRIGLSDIRLHDLRHSFASQAVRQGISLPVLSKLLGHSNLAMTMRYTHLSTPDIEASAARIAAIIAGQLETKDGGEL